MRCCAACIGDEALKKQVISALSVTKGKCDYCHSRDVFVIDPKDLNEYFAPLVSIYEVVEENKGGHELAEWLRTDWGMFDHEQMDNASVRSLLAEILNDGEHVRKKCRPNEK